ncbi:MAG TPA: LysM peptidoglycan-binding domain-containing protein [Thermoanaerobaculia bacterium]|nr:LysM peptidoglycan-binding domain-containing protein [Thermoanaerobaculia bacterium]
MVSGSKSAALSAVPALFLCFAAGCSSAGVRPSRNPEPAPAPKTAEQPTAKPTEAQKTATEHFYKGKALALAGDADCARSEFDQALESFRASARPGDSDDATFADQLYESVKLYRGLDEARTQPERPPAEDTHDSLLAAVPASSPEEVATAKREVEKTLEKTSDAFDIPMVVNEKVLKAVAFYQFRTPQLFAGALQRAGRYLPLMRQILKEQGLPQDLVYVAMVESAFKGRAHSRKAAHGFWQFISDTGRRYGLRQTRAFDERSDPVKSTLAAAAYFKDLYEMLGDWHLAMAAYDTGEGRILRGLQRTGARDYWELCDSSSLMQETRDYVPFVLAAALISRNPQRYGFDVVPDAPLTYDVVRVSRPVDLARVADAAGTTLDELRNLNAELKTRVTPRGFPEYPLRVPAGAGPVLAAKLAGLPAAPDVEERSVHTRKGDTVARVAARYRVSVADLCEWNDITKNTRLKRGTTLVLASHSSPKKERAAAEPAAVASADARPAYGQIRALPTPASAIKSPSDIGSIASLPQPSAAQVLPSRIDIPAKGFEDEAPKAVAAKKAPQDDFRRIVHTVRAGETLYRIAQKYGLTVDAIRRENRLGRRTLIAAGRRLTLTIAVIR